MTNCCSAHWWPGQTVSASTNEQSEDQPKSWALDVYRRSKLLDAVAAPFEQMMRWSYHWQPPRLRAEGRRPREVDSRIADILWYVLLGALGLYGGWRIYSFVHANLSWSDLAANGRAGRHHHDLG